MAQEEGTLCEGWNVHTGIAKFNPNKPPQSKPEIAKKWYQEQL